jgi:hypothetical protein
MFKKTETEREQGFWEGNEQGLSEKRKMFYEDKKAWHNQFRREITDRIDENIFKPLYCENNGRANAPTRMLVAMMALKEGKGMSDSELFEQLDYNMLARSAVGLINIGDEAPAQSTYYLFRKKLYEWEVEHGEDLLEKAFRDVTKAQCLEFGVKGQKVRMDSKLLGSNIAWLCRYQIVHETIRKYMKGASVNREALSEGSRKALEGVLKEEGNAVTYRCDKDEVAKRLCGLGVLANELLGQEGAARNVEYALLKRVFEENYEVTDGAVKPLEKTKISAKSVQNPHDPDAQYRNKNGQQVKGYSISLTETCDEGNVNLITDVQTEGAGTSDSKYFQKALEKTQELVGGKVEEVHTDGGYHSPENQTYCAEESRKIKFILGNISGKPSKYDLSIDEDGKLVVINKENGERLKAVRSKSKDPNAPERWRVKDGDHAPIYFDKSTVAVSTLRKKIAGLPKEVLNIRNNVEATMLQLGYHFRHDKSKYRGLVKHRMWAFSRCLWINFRRIVLWAGENTMARTKEDVEYAC